MKYLKLFLVIIAVVGMTGCATVTVREGMLNLDTFPEKSVQATEVQATKEGMNAAIAGQRATVAQNPNSAGLSERLASLLNMNGQYGEAITAAKRAIALNPSSISGFHNLGSAYRGKGQYDDALKAFKKASELDAKSDGDLMHLAVAYYHTGGYDEGIAAIDRAIDLKNYGTMGMRLEVETTYDIVTLRKMTVASVEEGGPADKAGIKVGDSFGISEIKTHKPSVSLDSIRKYIEGNPPGTPVEVTTMGAGAWDFPKKKTIILGRFKDPMLPLKLGIKASLLAMTGNTDEALKYATESLDSGQSSKASKHWAKTTLGMIHIGNGNYGEAIKLLSQEKDSATVRILEATAHAKLGDVQKAVDIYSAIPEGKLSPKHVPRWSDRAALLEELKPFAASKRENAARLKAQGRYREALSELGDVLRVADDAQGREVYKIMAEILRAEPQLARVPEEARKYRLRGDVLTEEGNFKEAAEQYRKAVQAAPYIAKLHYNTALVYGEIKRYPQAIRYMKTYLLLAPEAPNARAVKDQIYKWEFRMEKGE